MTRRTLISLAFLLLLIQFMPVNRSNPPVQADLQAQSEVKTVFKKACYDCHSNETVWPWYSRIAPASWMIAHHVKEGRGYTNFSTWEALDADTKRYAANEIRKEVEKGRMPLKPYTVLHREAKLTDAEKQLIYAWVEGHGAAVAPEGNDDQN